MTTITSDMQKIVIECLKRQLREVQDDLKRGQERLALLEEDLPRHRIAVEDGAKLALALQGVIEGIGQLPLSNLPPVLP